MKSLALLLLLALPCYAQTTRITQGDAVTSGLVAWWPLEDNGATTTDRSGTGNTGTLTNSPPTVSGAMGRSLSFNGSSHAVIVADNSSLSFTDGSGNDLPFTITAWVNEAAWPSVFFVVNKRGNTSDTEWQMGGNSAGQFNLVLWSGGGNTVYIFAQSVAAVPLNKWTFIAATYSGSETVGGILLYINGKATTVTTGSAGSYTGMQNGGSQLVIGRSSFADAQHFSGLIDELHIYNRALSAAEISALYNSRKHLYGGE